MERGQRSGFNSRLSPAMHSLRLISLVLMLSLGTSSCWFRTKRKPRVFVPPPVRARPVTLPLQPQLPEPGLDLNVTAAIPEFPVILPNLPPPPEPPKRIPVTVAPKATPTPPPEPPPPPKLEQIFTAEQSREFNRQLDESLERVRRTLAVLGGRNLSAAQTEAVARIRTFLRQAEQAREQDLVTAVNLARRADVLAQDLAGRLP